MIESRLPTEFIISSYIKRCDLKGIPIYIRQRGDRHSGTIILKIQIEKAVRIFSQIRNMEEKLDWFDVFKENITEMAAEEYISKSIEYDSDVWVIEIELRLKDIEFIQEMTGLSLLHHK